MDYEQARVFLAKVVPWPLDNEDGWINVHWVEKDSKVWVGRACRSIDELIRTINWASSKGPTKNFYVCLSRQSKMEQTTGRNGGVYNKAIRKSENATHFRSIWLDLDFKQYSSAEETAAAFAEFLKQTKLPSPSVYVNSGGGFQIYWTFETLDPIQWTPLARALSEACKRHELKADVACTTDHSRILRIPDTQNTKYTPHRIVKLLHIKDYDYMYARLAEPLKPYYVAVHGAKVNNELGAGVYQFQPMDVSRIVPVCSFLQDAIKTHGAFHSQPLWNMTALVSTFTTQGRGLFHKLANGYPGYTKENNDALYDRKERERKEKNLGWPTCQAIENAGSTVCKTCKYRSQNKTPFHHANAASKVNGFHHEVASKASPSFLPDGFRHMDNLMVQASEIDEDGVEHVGNIANWPIYNGWLEKEKDDSYNLFFTTLFNDKEKIIRLPMAAAGLPESRKILQAQGCEIRSDQVKKLGAFTVAWISKLKENKVFKNLTSYGWNVSNGEIVGFTFGGHVWKPTGNIVSSPVDRIDDELYSPIGKLDKWRDAAKLVTDQNRVELNALLATSFGAPLVRFTGQSAFLVSAYSLESGIGKTTAMKVAQSVWAHPTKAMQTLTDTTNAVLNRIGRVNSLPLYWDEMRVSANTRSAIEFLLQLTSGREKSRLDANAQAREVRAWNTILVCASNDSLINFVASQSNTSAAAINRVIEFVVTPGQQGKIDISDASKIISDLEFNYGLAGNIYGEFLGTNFPAIEREVRECLKAIESEMKIDTGERFWLANVACLLTGAKYANQLELTDINIDQLREFLFGNFNAMRSDRQESVVDFQHNEADVARIVTQFINEIGNTHILKTDKIFSRAGRPTPGEVNLIAMPRDMPWVQIGVAENKVRISSDQFEKWLREKSKYSDNYRTVMKQILLHPGVQRAKARIGAGCNVFSTQEFMLDFDGSQIPDLNVNEDGVVAEQSNVVAIR